MGRLTAKKRPELAIRALAVGVQKGCRVNMAVAGPDEDGLAQGLAREAERLGVSSGVVFMGMVSGSRKAAMFRAADNDIKSSAGENFGITVAEALS